MTPDAGRRIQRVQHVSLPFPGSDASMAVARHVYADVLGLEEVRRPPAIPGPGLWFAVGDQELHLFSEASGVAANGESRRHPCFQVGDVAALRAHLVANGLTTRDDDGTIPGRPRFFGVDPFGNTLEFVQFDEGHW